MATSGAFETGAVGGLGSSPNRVRFEWGLAGQNTGGNYSTINWNVRGWGGAGGYWTRNFQSNTYIHGSHVQGTGTFDMYQNSVFGSGSINIGHDANGNMSFGANSNNKIYYNSWNSSGSGSWALPRIAKAPSIYGNLVDTITNTTARLGTEINNYGNGTSAATRMYYKLSTSGSWTWATSDQGDAGGYNYWTVSSLTPNTTYNYFSRWWNNNGDTADSGSSSFKTLASGTLGAVSGLKHNQVTIATTIAASGTSESNPTSKIQYRISGASTWTDSSTSTSLSPSFTLTGLKANTVYEYRLSCTNSTGTWTSSNVTFKTGNPPGFVFILEEY